MTKKNVVPQWVRSSVCLTGCTCMAGILLVRLNGIEIDNAVSWPLAIFAMRTASLAFDRKDLAISELAQLRKAA
jgi:hypothetical protein